MIDEFEEFAVKNSVKFEFKRSWVSDMIRNRWSFRMLPNSLNQKHFNKKLKKVSYAQTTAIPQKKSSNIKTNHKFVMTLLSMCQQIINSMPTIFLNKLFCFFCIQSCNYNKYCMKSSRMTGERGWSSKRFFQISHRKVQ